MRLAERGNRQATAVLLEMLTQGDRWDKKVAAESLASLGASDAAIPIAEAALAAAKKWEEFEVREFLTALSQFPPAVYAAALSHIMAHTENYQVRDEALKRLVSLGTPAVEPLAAALILMRAELQPAVYRELKLLGWKPKIPTHEALEERLEKVDQAFKAMWSIGYKEPATKVSETESVARGLAELGSGVVGVLIGAAQARRERGDIVGHHNLLAALTLLGLIGDPAAVSFLLQELKAGIKPNHGYRGGVEDGEVAVAAAQGIERLLTASSGRISTALIQEILLIPEKVTDERTDAGWDTTVSYDLDFSGLRAAARSALDRLGQVGAV